LPGLAGGLETQVTAPLGGGVRLGSQQSFVQAGGVTAAGRRPAQRGAVRGLALAEQQIIGLAFDGLAGLEAEGLERLVPTSGRVALPRSRWPGGNSWPRP
jgi:hypothetical protein